MELKTIIVPPPQQPLSPAQFGMPGVVVVSAFSPRLAIDSVEPDDPVSIGSLGNPVYCEIQFQPGSYMDKAGITQTYEGVTLQTILMVVDQQKKVVTTPIDGADGEVIEYVGLGNYQIQINGVIDGLNGRHPKEEVAALIKVLEVPKAISVVCWYLHQFSIDNIVVTDFTFPQVPGGYSSQQFSIFAISDKKLEAKIKDPS